MQNHSGKTNLDLLEQEIVSGSGKKCKNIFSNTMMTLAIYVGSIQQQLRSVEILQGHVHRRLGLRWRVASLWNGDVLGLVHTRQTVRHTQEVDIAPLHRTDLHQHLQH